MFKGRSFTGDDGRYDVAGLTPGSFEIVVKQNMSVLLRQGINLTAQRTCDFMLP
jgi:protocatechuate 3,4-dioxygenase beta subunit